MEETIDGHLLSDVILDGSHYNRHNNDYHGSVVQNLAAKMTNNMFKLKIDPNLVVFGFCCKPLYWMAAIQDGCQYGHQMFKLKIYPNLIVLSVCCKSH